MPSHQPSFSIPASSTKTITTIESFMCLQYALFLVVHILLAPLKLTLVLFAFIFILFVLVFLLPDSNEDYPTRKIVEYELVL
ncbi:hypothetical protein L596_026355 [Steinernema carpocapsae]|uniref:Uncharacterized protein n=1 Tax=Steinernema carpocapsae TaxID=34508 RepID=A0A4U5M156_STECR|nr:hypothetical protein L596_026355 [Steinernema carpocapsae]